jgi:hypothetical protein
VREEVAEQEFQCCCAAEKRFPYDCECHISTMQGDSEDIDIFLYA